MTNDDDPHHVQGALEIFIEKLNLPQMIAGPAGKAISRLVAGVVEIPAAYLDSFTQSLKDKTVARTTVTNEVAKAAAKLAANDSDIVARAAHNLLAKEYRHQKNKEEIARKTVEILSDSKNENSESQSTQDGKNVDDDWLNVFEKYAQEASSERLQNLWARILVGEIRKTKSFSLKTLRFVSELDQETATVFEKYVPKICSDALFTPPPITGTPFAELMHLQDAGLISGVGGLVQKIFTLNETGQVLVPQQNRMLLIEGKAGLKIEISAALLTNVGKEVARIVQIPFDAEFGKVVAAAIPKANLTSISFGGFVPTKDGIKLIPNIPLWTSNSPSPTPS